MAASLSSGGCVPKTQGDRLIEQNQDHNARIRAIETTLENQESGLGEAIEEAHERVAELREILEQATQAVTRNSADLGTEVQQLRSQIARLEGQIAELRNELAQTRGQLQQRDEEIAALVNRLAHHSGVDLEIEESAIPDNANAHFQAAESAFERSDFDRSRGLFRIFINRYSDDERVDNALYLVGKSYMEQNRPQNAVGTFQEIVRDHRDGDAMDETLLAMAEALFRMGACSDARAALEALIQGHQDSPHVGAARRLLRSVRAAAPRQCPHG